MANTTDQIFKDNLIALLDEAFVEVRGIFLDRNTSFLETLRPITAEQASKASINGGASIAGHVEHVRFYIRVLNDYIDNREIGKIDWGQSWLCKSVSDSQWQELMSALNADYLILRTKVAAINDWNDDKKLGGALAIVVHTAYHLGAIRQMIKIVS
jgi:hypothetical protein